MLTILDVMLGLIFFFLLMSLMCMIINELISNIFRLRSKNLFVEINRVLDDATIRNKFWNSGLIRSYCRPCAAVKDADAPERLNPGVFASALIRAIGEQNGKPLSASIRADSILKDVITELEAAAAAKAGQIEDTIAAWYDTTMQRASAVYRQKLQLISLLVAVFVCLATNADTHKIAKALWADADLRTQVASAASKYIEDNAEEFASSLTDTNANTAGQNPPAQDDAEPNLQEAFEEFESGLEAINTELRSFPIGWDVENLPSSASEVGATALGIAFTALAITLGAPFWFDLLAFFLRLRFGSGKEANSAGNPFSKRATPSETPSSKK